MSDGGLFGFGLLGRLGESRTSSIQSSINGIMNSNNDMIKELGKIEEIDLKIQDLLGEVGDISSNSGEDADVIGSADQEAAGIEKSYYLDGDMTKNFEGRLNEIGIRIDENERLTQDCCAARTRVLENKPDWWTSEEEGWKAKMGEMDRDLGNMGKFIEDIKGNPIKVDARTWDVFDGMLEKRGIELASFPKIESVRDRFDVLRDGQIPERRRGREIREIIGDRVSMKLDSLEGIVGFDRLPGVLKRDAELMENMLDYRGTLIDKINSTDLMGKISLAVGGLLEFMRKVSSLKGKLSDMMGEAKFPTSLPSMFNDFDMIVAFTSEGAGLDVSHYPGVRSGKSIGPIIGTEPYHSKPPNFCVYTSKPKDVVDNIKKIEDLHHVHLGTWDDRDSWDSDADIANIKNRYTDTITPLIKEHIKKKIDAFGDKLKVLEGDGENLEKLREKASALIRDCMSAFGGVGIYKQ